MCIRETAFLKYLKDYVKDIEAIVMRERKIEEREGEREKSEGQSGESGKEREERERAGVEKEVCRVDN